MSTWQTALGINVIQNPLVDSPYVVQLNIGGSVPPPPVGDEILTEGGTFILTEGGSLLNTE